MEFRADYKSDIAAGAKADADAVRALRSELEKASGGVDKLAQAKGPTAGASPTTSTKDPFVEAQRKAFEQGEKARKDNERRFYDDTERKRKEKLDARKRAKDAAKDAAAGGAGAASLARLAMGYQGMARLQALGYRTQIQMRQLFRGVDSTPAVRAADKFLQSIFNPASAAGKALSGIFTRAGNGLAKGLEDAQPIATKAFQALILGGLELENRWMELRIAAYPVTSAIGDMVGPTLDMADAANIGAVAVGALGLAAVGASAPFIAMATAIGVAYDQYRKMKAEFAAGGDRALNNAKIVKKFGEGSWEADVAYGTAKTNDTPQEKAAAKRARDEWNRANGLGEASGEAYSAGVAKGVANGADAAAAAGGAVADAVDARFRAKAEIKSPSKRAERSARHIPEGTAIGLEKGAADVQAAADRALVPNMPGGTAGGRGGNGAPASIAITLVIQGTGNVDNDLQTAARRVFNEEIRAFFGSIGITPILSAVGGVP